MNSHSNFCAVYYSIGTAYYAGYEKQGEMAAFTRYVSLSIVNQQGIEDIQYPNCTSVLSKESTTDNEAGIFFPFLWEARYQCNNIQKGLCSTSSSG